MISSDDIDVSEDISFDCYIMAWIVLLVSFRAFLSPSQHLLQDLIVALTISFIYVSSNPQLLVFQRVRMALVLCELRRQERGRFDYRQSLTVARALQLLNWPEIKLWLLLYYQINYCRCALLVPVHSLDKCNRITAPRWKMINHRFNSNGNIVLLWNIWLEKLLVPVQMLALNALAPFISRWSAMSAILWRGKYSNLWPPFIPLMNYVYCGERFAIFVKWTTTADTERWPGRSRVNCARRTSVCAFVPYDKTIIT